MNKFIKIVKNLAREEDGVTAIEYGLIAALIAVAIIVSVGFIGDNLVTVFDYIKDELAAAIPAAA